MNFSGKMDYHTGKGMNNMHSILIVEDDMNINGLLKEAFEK